jgi:MFS transporter, MHS family, proline/betaine transporter
MSKQKILVKDIMITKVQCVDELHSVIDVCKLMSKYNIGAIIVQSSSEVLSAKSVGIFTERDLMKKVISTNSDINKPVKDFMTKDFKTLDLEHKVSEIPYTLTEGYFRHLPVMQQDKLMGIISIKDIIRVHLNSEMEGLKIGTGKIRDIVGLDEIHESLKLIPETSSILEAVSIMAKHNIGSVITLDSEQNPIGIFTERDILRKIISLNVSLDQPISEYMTRNFRYVTLDDDLKAVPQIMLNGNFRHLPVMDQGKVVEIISMRDIITVFNNNKISIES